MAGVRRSGFLGGLLLFFQASPPDMRGVPHHSFSRSVSEMLRGPNLHHPHHDQQIVNSSAQEPFPVHSAHVGQICRVHYRWHAYFGSDVRVFRVYQSGDEQYAALERDPGVVVMAPAWVLNAAVCSTLSLGMPLVSIAALNDLHGHCQVVCQRLQRAVGGVVRRSSQGHSHSKDRGHPIGRGGSGWRSFDIGGGGRLC